MISIGSRYCSVLADWFAAILLEQNGPVFLYTFNIRCKWHSSATPEIALRQIQKLHSAGCRRAYGQNLHRKRHRQPLMTAAFDRAGTKRLETRPMEFGYWPHIHAVVAFTENCGSEFEIIEAFHIGMVAAAQKYGYFDEPHRKSVPSNARDISEVVRYIMKDALLLEQRENRCGVAWKIFPEGFPVTQISRRAPAPSLSAS